MKSTSILHGTCMEPPWKLHQLEGAMQPSRLDTRNNGTYMKPPWNLHQFSMEPAWILHQRSAIQAPGVDTGNRDFFFSGHYVETIRRFDANWSQIDRKLIVKKRTKTVIASVHFDVVFTRSSVFVDVPFCFCTGKVNFFQSFYLSWVFTAWWFRFWQGFKCEFLFDVISMEFYVCLGVNLMEVPNI